MGILCKAGRPCLAWIRTERGSQTVEWTLVSVLLTMLFCAVLQIGFAMHIRSTLIDAAAEGARLAGLRNADPNVAAAHTRLLIDTAIAEQYAGEISVERTHEVAKVRVRAPLPLIGPLGIPDTLEIEAIAPIE